MKPPQAPALMALGLSPSEIQRPVTPTEFGMALASGLSHGTSLSPLDNFGIQVAPYWMAKHPDLTASDLDGHQRWAVLRNFSLSAGAAAVKLTDTAGTPVDAKRWAAGARTTLYPGWQSASAVACQQAISQALDKGSGELAAARTAFEAEWDHNHPRPPLAAQLPPGPDPGAPEFNAGGTFDHSAFDAAVAAWRAARDRIRANEGGDFLTWARERDAAVQAWLAQYEKARAADPALHQCLTTMHDRVGFMAELTGAFSMTLPGGDFQKSPALRSYQQTYWLTLGYVLDRAAGQWNHALDVSLLAIGRYQDDTPAEGSSTRRLDAGGRLVLAWDRYGASVEGTFRREAPNGAPAANESRFGLSLDFRLAGGAWATVVFGKDFGTSDSTPLIALANLQWNLGIDRQLSLDRSLTQEPDVSHSGTSADAK